MRKRQSPALTAIIYAHKKFSTETHFVDHRRAMILLTPPTTKKDFFYCRPSPFISTHRHSSHTTKKTYLRDKEGKKITN